MTSTGFQPQTGFQQGGFQDTSGQTGFQPTASPGGKLDMDAITAFSKGNAQAVPVGYEQGFANGAAKKRGQQSDSFSQTGFVDTNESSEYGRGYAYGLAQGYALGYVEGLKST